MKHQLLNRRLDNRKMRSCILTIAMLTLGACAANKNLHSDRGGRFNAADTNHDGKLIEQEWTGGDPGRLADFKKRDANHDGIVTKEEALAYGRTHGEMNNIFQEADKNHDGYLNRAEVQTYYASRE